MTQVADIMSRSVRTLAPTDSIVAAAKAMSELDVGVIPVCDGEKLVGMVTDRDIVLRAVAKQRASDETPLSDVMSDAPSWCFEDQSVDEVADQMRDQQIRRVPVLDRSKNLVGMLSLGDMSTRGSTETAGEALKSISEPAEPRNAGSGA